MTSPLTAAELRILPYLQTHLTYSEIGQQLCVSANTVRTQVSSIYRKLGANSRSAAIRQAISLGLTPDYVQYITGRAYE